LLEPEFIGLMNNYKKKFVVFRACRERLLELE
jgi:hypothetical protein